MNISDLYQGILEGNRRALAKSISAIEDQHPECEELMSRVYKHTGKAHIIGVTGPPGAGKSTLVDKVAKAFRDRGRTIGIVAVDPTSPFTGGAILGDRIRMTGLSTDRDIFIRSMGTRGHLGGLARATSDVIRLMDAFGKDVIIVETVGAGQSEVDIVENAHTTVIVEMPGLGDDIQAIKAGLFEIANIFVINKSDMEGCDRSLREIQIMLEMSQKSPDDWDVPVLKASARDNTGIQELADTIDLHYNYLKKKNLLEELKYKSLKYNFLEILKEKLIDFSFDESTKKDSDILKSLKSGKTDPYTAAETVITRLKVKKE
jgi:LAO/AO transport system kinase